MRTFLVAAFFAAVLLPLPSTPIQAQSQCTKECLESCIFPPWKCCKWGGWQCKNVSTKKMSKAKSEKQ
jgi:hypothetical protein